MPRREGSTLRPKGQKPVAEVVRCANCDGRCRPHYATEWRRSEVPGHVWSECWYTGKILFYGIVGGKFCTNVCAIRFGLRCAHAGVTFEKFDTFREDRRVS